MTREVAIKAIQDFIGWFKEDSLIRKALDMAIQALSQEPKWIPVSERLPEDGTYLVTVERTVLGKLRIEMRSFARDLNKVDEFDFPKHKSGWYDYDSEWGHWEDTNVIAWMPLPKTYEPQESEVRNEVNQRGKRDMQGVWQT